MRSPPSRTRDGTERLPLFQLGKLCGKVKPKLSGWIGKNNSKAKA